MLLVLLLLQNLAGAEAGDRVAAFKKWQQEESQREEVRLRRIDQQRDLRQKWRQDYERIRSTFRRPPARDAEKDEEKYVKLMEQREQQYNQQQSIFSEHEEKARAYYEHVVVPQKMMEYEIKD